MKKTFLLMAAIAAMCVAGAAEKPIVVFTFDDGALEHYRDVAPILEKYGFRGTFNLITDATDHNNAAGWFMSWDQVRELTKRGHAFESHTVTHPNLEELWRKGETNEIRRQVAESRDRIAQQTGVRPVLLCHPYCARTNGVDAIIREEGLVPMDWHRNNFGLGTKPGDVAKFVAERSAKGEKIVDLLVHGVNKNGGAWHPFDSPAHFEEFVKEVKDLVDKGEIRCMLYRDAVRPVKK